MVTEVQGAWIGEIAVGSGMSRGWAACYAESGSNMSANNYDHPFGTDEGGVPGPGASYGAVGWSPGTNPQTCAWNNGQIAAGIFNITSAQIAASAAAVGADPATLDHWVVRVTPETGGAYSSGALREVDQDPFGSTTTMAQVNDPDPDGFMTNLLARVYLLSTSFSLGSPSSVDAANATVVANAPISGAANGYLSTRGYYTNITGALGAGFHLGDVAVGGTASPAVFFTVSDQPGHSFSIAVAHASVTDHADTTPAMSFPAWTATSICTNTPNVVYRRHLYDLPSLNIAPVFRVRDEWLIGAVPFVAPCSPGPITLPYQNTFSGVFDTTFASCDGSTWTNSGGYLQCTNLGGNAFASLLADAGSEEIDMEITWGHSASTLHFAGVFFNYLDENNFHLLRGDSGASQVWRCVGGVMTQVPGNAVPGPVGAGRVTRIILKSGMLFIVDYQFGSPATSTPVVWMAPSDVISGGTLVGFQTYDTANLFDSIIFKSPLYFNDLGSLPASTNTGLINAGSQYQASIYRITSYGGSASPQQWTLLFNGWDSGGHYGVWLQHADSTAAFDFEQEFFIGGSTGAAHEASNLGGTGTWLAQVTWGQHVSILVSTDGITWNRVGSLSIAMGHPEAYDPGNTYYLYDLTNRVSYDNCKTWAFTP